jgi:hypothetical protein
VLSKDNLKIAFAVHTVWRVDEARVPLFMERYSTTVSDGGHEKVPDAIVKVAYGNFIREPLRTFARAEGDGQFAEPHRRLHSGGTDGRADHRDVPDGAVDRGDRYTIDVTPASASMMR